VGVMSARERGHDKTLSVEQRALHTENCFARHNLGLRSDQMLPGQGHHQTRCPVLVTVAVHTRLCGLTLFTVVLFVKGNKPICPFNHAKQRSFHANDLWP
jgi:hypothetical protein